MDDFSSVFHRFSLSQITLLRKNNCSNLMASFRRNNLHRCIGSFAWIPRDQLSNICNKLAVRTETGYSIDSLRNIYAHLPGVKLVLIDTRAFLDLKQT